MNGHLVEPYRSFGELKNVMENEYLIPKIVSNTHARTTCGLSLSCDKMKRHSLGSYSAKRKLIPQVECRQFCRVNSIFIII